MEKRLVETPYEDGVKYFHFVKCDEYEHFYKAFEVIDDIIKPSQSNYLGLIEKYGYFIKDGIRVDVEHDSMIGNMFIYKDTGREEDLEKLRGWMQIIWDGVKDLEIKY